MSAVEHHIIHRQIVEMAFGGPEAEALAAQGRLARLCHDWLAPALEAALTRVGPADEHWRIDRLEIDIGSLRLDELERLGVLVGEAVERELGGVRAWPSRPSRRSGQAPDSGGERSGPATPAVPFERRTPAEAARDAFLHFLRTGVLPWWFRLPRGKTLEETLGEAEPAVVSGAAVLARGLAEVLRLPAALERLVRQFSPRLLGALLAALSSEAAAALAERLEGLPGRPAPGDPEQALPRRRLWALAFAAAVAGEKLPDSSRVARPAENVAPAEDAAPAAQPDDAAVHDLRGAPPVPPRVRADPTRPSAPPPDHERPIDAELEQGLHVEHAGVVLLHPFLPRLFEKLGLADGETLREPERALGLLDFLATGRPRAPEHDLVVAKHLCGVPLDTSVASLELTAAERDEALVMLEAVIGHWEALGGTSVDGLRGSFLVRRGRLSRRGGEDVLQLEPAGYDVLLDQLPWGIGLIQLPWMRRALHVEWRL